MPPMKITDCKLVKIDPVDSGRLYETERELTYKLQEAYDAGYHVQGFINADGNTYMVTVTQEEN